LENAYRILPTHHNESIWRSTPEEFLMKVLALFAALASSIVSAQHFSQQFYELPVPRPAPAFSARDKTGKTWSNKDLSNKLVLMYWWAYD
jgi:hypothetical protein